MTKIDTKDPWDTLEDAYSSMLQALISLVENDLIKDKGGDHYQEVLDAIRKGSGDVKLGSKNCRRCGASFRPKSTGDDFCGAYCLQEG